MTSSRPTASRQPRRIRSLVAATLAVAGITGTAIVADLPIVGADPAAGDGPITVDDSGHWFEYAGNGEPYFMAGAGGPEGFLYYSDARRQAIVDRLIDNDVRAVYIHAVRSNGGDGGANENPFIGSDPSNGVDPDVLDEWDSYLSQLDAAGIVTWFHLYDDGARPFGACNPDLPAAERQFVKTIVERFREYRHLVWLPTEEHIIKACSDNSVDLEKAEALAAEIRTHDDVHPLGVHHNNGQSNQYLGNTDIDVFAQQVCQQSKYTSVDGIHDAGEFGEDVYVMAECHPWHKELLDRGERSTLRQSFWSSVMAGGYVLFYDAWESNDPTDAMLADLGRINAFMDTTRFAETVPADQLAAGGTKWVLGNETSDVYIAYSNDDPASMGVQGMSAGTYDLGWFDPVTGERVDQTVTVGNGTAAFVVPGQIGSEVALSIEPSTDTPTTTTTTTTTSTVPVTTTTPPTTAPPTTTSPSTTTPPTSIPPTTPPTSIPPTTTPPMSPSRVELVAVEDAFLEGTKRVNDTELRVEHGSRTRISYVRFDTSGIEAADTVRFRLTVGSDPGQGTVAVSLGTGGRWTSDTLTPSNAPAIGELLAAVSGTFATGQEIDVELPAEAVAGAALDLVITHDGAGSDDVSFDASESGVGPTLVVETSVKPPTTTPPTPTSRVELVAVEDAFLEGTTRVNDSQLRVEHGSRTRIGYVRFDTSGLGVASRVLLELVVGSDPGQGTVSVSRGEGGNWTSDTLSPGNAPVAGDELASVSGSFTTGQRLSVDLPVDAIAGDTLDLVIAHDGAGADDVSFDATETGDGPALIVETSVTTPPTTTPPTTTPPTTTPPTTTPPTTTAPTTTLPPTENPTQTVGFRGTEAAVANPERGFHKGVSVADSASGSTTSVSQMSSYYDAGIRLARMYVRLDDYRNSPIPDALLDDLDDVFANARSAGIKLIPRFSYNFGSAPDATVDRIEQHLEQLTPVLRANSNVISVLQAGFIGAWGEWHSSSNGLTNPSDRARVRNALLQALPTHRMTQFRYPDDIIEFEPAPLDAARAFDGSALSRTGHKNDCFLANEHDAGTYIPLSRKGEFVDYLATMTEFTVMGGETCQVSAGSQRTDCPTALTELELFHWDYLNLDFYGDTIDRWRTDGCFDEIDARLGYRYEMRAASAPTRVAAGGRLELELVVANVGFGKLYNPRPMNVVLVNDSTGATMRIERVADARDVMPLPGSTRMLDLTVDVPVGLGPGSYSIHLELPDGSPSLTGDPRYSIRMANAGTWRAVSGTNDLTLDVVVDHHAAGSPGGTTARPT